MSTVRAREAAAETPDRVTNRRTAEGALAADFGALDLARLRREARDDERVAEERRAL
jgi:hypothetical protein